MPEKARVRILIDGQHVTWSERQVKHGWQCFSHIF